MQSTIDYIINITPVTDTTFGNITINNNSKSLVNYNLGWFIDLTSMSIANSITDLNIQSEFNFTLSEYSADIQPQIELLINNIEGSYIQVYATNNEGMKKSKCIYNGYVSSVPSSANLKSGSQFTLVANTLLSQLSVMTSSGSWDDATKTYGSVFTTISAGKVNFSQLLEDVLKGTLLEGSSFEIKDYGLRPIPTEVWASIIPSNSKLQVLREILIAYSRIVYQASNGDLIISALSSSYLSPKTYNIDVKNNSGNYIAISSISKASSIPNRIDCQFGVTAMWDDYGNTLSTPEDNQNIYCSAPNIDSISNKIISPDNAYLDYTKVYKKSCNLYNSGKFIIPSLINPVIGDNLLSDPVMMNAFNNYNNYSTILNAPKGSENKISLSLMYAQLFLAEVNVNNYNASIIYDYTKLIDSNEPLTSIVTINNYPYIDYNQMLIDKTIINVHVQTGSTMQVTTIPLLSMTGVWSK